MADDPRKDQHPDDGVPGKFPTPPGDAEKAPGGAGTGTAGDPAKAPEAQPPKGDDK